MKLTQEEKRIKIAEACGWTRVPDNDETVKLWTKNGHTTSRGWREHFLKELPDYFNDLNAIQEAEVEIKRSFQCMNYAEALYTECAKENIPFIYATAAQRAEAFGLTLNLWTHDS